MFCVISESYLIPKIIYLKLIFSWISCILSSNPNFSCIKFFSVLSMHSNKSQITRRKTADNGANTVKVIRDKRTQVLDISFQLHLDY